MLVKGPAKIYAVRVNSDVFANPRSKEGFFDGVNLLLSFMTDDASI